MLAPEGWTIERGERWALMRDPNGGGALFLYGVTDALRSPEMLHEAERRLGMTMPVGLGQLTSVPSGLRFMVETEDVVSKDGMAARVFHVHGASPKLHGRPGSVAGTGLFGVLRGDATPEDRAGVLAAIDSLAPM